MKLVCQGLRIKNGCITQRFLFTIISWNFQGLNQRWLVTYRMTLSMKTLSLSIEIHPWREWQKRWTMAMAEKDAGLVTSTSGVALFICWLWPGCSVISYWSLLVLQTLPLQAQVLLSLSNAGARVVSFTNPLAQVRQGTCLVLEMLLLHLENVHNFLWCRLSYNQEEIYMRKTHVKSKK